MKTIRQIADEIGVSKQAIFYRIKRPPLSNDLQSLTTKLDGVLMVSFDGETLIKQAFSIDAVKAFGDKEPSKENTSFDGDIIKLLQDNIAILQSQLEVKDRQIEELTATVRTQAESISADRKNELAGTLIDGQRKFLDGEVASKKWWQFWK
ncbi:MAG: hypothetical protein FWD05_13365 [Oscillospiraceae bacterium]|nr:hypothetical protein [Oscillospiraceae bacterium]